MGKLYLERLVGGVAFKFSETRPGLCDYLNLYDNVSLRVFIEELSDVMGIDFGDYAGVESFRNRVVSVGDIEIDMIDPRKHCGVKYYEIFSEMMLEVDGDLFHLEAIYKGNRCFIWLNTRYMDLAGMGNRIELTDRQVIGLGVYLSSVVSVMERDFVDGGEI